ncbi:hypothetical protein HYC85_008441 [Camellia sinensis]|uniref:Glycosyltransferase n=1 Tax=Camellia sinensis TaxID=4442 RepID=A0A7J7HST7_CAMSI|nr:hypothetical protein HYC85_008441 [Camellia sinensis]
MAKEDQKLSVVFLPYLAPSHIIPMVDIARLFAGRGVAATIITTTNNALLFRDSVNHDAASGLNISVHTIKLPSAQVGLPEGIENFGQCTSPQLMAKLGYAIVLLQNQIEEFIRDNPPDCIVSDMFFPWTVDLADELQVPRIMLYPSNSFFHCVSHSLRLYAPHEKVQSDSEDFLIPGLLDEIRMARSELQDHFKAKSRYGDLINSIRETEGRSYGIILTSFYDLEPAYSDHFKKVVASKCWNLGPLSLFTNRGNVGQENNSGEEKHSCLSWLDTQKPNSVLYVCFGSMVQFSDAQLTQIALALEASGHPFVWVVRKEGKSEGKQEERWAPQLEILDHQAVGGFLNHCGWNSLLESLTAGLPLISWPLFAEHFYNSKLSTQVLKIGVEIGPRVWNPGFEINSPLVGMDELTKAITFLMGGSPEAVKMRQRAEEIGIKAKRAVEEGGRSYCDLKALIEELKAYALQK